MQSSIVVTPYLEFYIIIVGMWINVFKTLYINNNLFLFFVLLIVSSKGFLCYWETETDGGYPYRIHRNVESLIKIKGRSKVYHIIITENK